MVQQKKNLRIEVRNAAYALEQGQARVEAARKARDLAQKTFDIKRQEQQLGAGSNFETLTAEHDLAVASSTLASAETAYEKSRVALYSQTGQTLKRLGISMDDARSGIVRQAGFAGTPVCIATSSCADAATGAAAAIYLAAPGTTASHHPTIVE